MSRLISHFKNAISTSLSDKRGSIGIFCPYSVEELIDAAGFKPLRLTPDRSELQLADGYLPSNFCSYLRHIADGALRGELKDISGILFSHSCDGARRTFDLFDHYIGNIPAQFIDVPKSSDELSVTYFRKQLYLVTSFLERLGGKPASHESIARSISTYNRNRELLRKLYTLVSSSRGKPGAADLRLILDYNNSVFKKEANTVLEEVIAELESANDVPAEKPFKHRRRVFISGNMFDSLPLLDYIEECGGVVVGDDFCFGGRYSQLTIEEHGDPITALAKGYLNRVPCGRMKNNKDRFDFLLGEIERTSARGIIYTSLKFCDHFLVDYPAFKAMLDERGIPSLFLEGEYFSFAAGQIKTRVEAFLEML
jgi:benzoyl-CoA reductase/2-hydroxyglutaryl-CoA dehydratase subunit BcrC/BadD/HgdB